MDKIRDIVGNGYTLSILGDLNRWIRDRVRAGKTGTFGVPGEIDICAERVLCVGNTYFKRRSFQKYTRVARG